MKILKNIFGAFWAVWGILTFVATLLIVVLPICITYLIREPLGTEIFRRISKVWMTCWLAMIGSPLNVTGKEKFQKGKNYVVVVNHNSLMDVPVVTPFVPGANKTIGKTSFSKVPFFGWVYKRGSVLVDRKSDESRRRSFDEMKKTLADGLHMVVYPEGTRNRTGDPLKSFHDGAFRLATSTGKEIIPAILLNTKKVLPLNKAFYFWPHRLEMRFLEPVSPEGLTTKELKEKVFKIMWDYYLEHNK
jgi:1-acyl-sn-glycerol-3-phosphate acyltransferase